MARNSLGERSIWRTTNGGLNWTRTPIAPLAANYPAVRLEAVDNNTLWLTQAAGFSYATSRSSDGGLTWQRVTPPHSGVDPYNKRPVTRLGNVAAWARSKLCNVIELTESAGSAWRMIGAPPQDPPFVWFPGDNNCQSRLLWPGGSANYPLLHTSRGRWYIDTEFGAGSSWVQVLGRTPAQDTQVETKTVWFFDSQRWDSIFASTTDGGRSWTPKTGSALPWSSGSRMTRARIQFGGNGLGWTITETANTVFRTSNAGQTWQKITLPSTTGGSDPERNLGDIHFSDDAHGWIVKRRAPAPTADTALWSTSNGGVSWQVRTAPPFAPNALFFNSATNGLVVGEAGAIGQTSDSGSSWQLRSSGVTTALNQVFFVNASLGFVIGDAGVVLRSSDGGASWTRIAVPVSTRLNAVRFADPQSGWVVGDAGTVLATLDGGLNWSVQQSGSLKNLVALYSIDTGTAWAVDEEGRAIVTATAGTSGTGNVAVQQSARRSVGSTKR